MADCILRNDAICIADYAADEHPYDKDRTRPETYSEYNQGWNDACDYIRGKLEAEKPADVEPVRHGRWLDTNVFMGVTSGRCSACGLYSGAWHINEPYRYCPFCGARMIWRTNNED